MRVHRVPHTAAPLLTTLATAAAVACGGAVQTEPQTAPTPGSASESSSKAELEAIYKTRTDSERLRYTDADVRFMTGMISHHAQALVMSALAPTHGASPAMRRLTARTINAQQDEITLMQRWLRERGLGVPEVHIEGITLKMTGGGDDAMHMPGMLTPDQMRKLDEARGVDFDRAFLTYMIQHHSGAITMVHELFATDGAAQGVLTFKLASDIQVDQATEIERMKLMLEALPDPGRRR